LRLTALRRAAVAAVAAVGTAAVVAGMAVVVAGMAAAHIPARRTRAALRITALRPPQ